MYTKFYGLQEKPFETAANPRFLYLSDKHREALAHLRYAVQERKGFTVITGEVGTGKTTLVQSLLSQMNGRVRTIFLFHPTLGVKDFWHYICNDLGVKGPMRSKGECLTHLHRFLLQCFAQKENVVLIVDEAQGLNPRLLEEVRLLTNLETKEGKLLQVILMGQPELSEILNLPRFRQLKQRINVRYHLLPLNRRETGEYIQTRLRVAKAQIPGIFAPSAVKEIYKVTGGIPRLINIVCDNALVTGYAKEKKEIDKGIIREVIHDLQQTRPSKPRRLIILFALLLWGGLTALVAWQWGEKIFWFLRDLWIYF
jgi:general secretion pathway protein A